MRQSPAGSQLDKPANTVVRLKSLYGCRQLSPGIQIEAARECGPAQEVQLLPDHLVLVCNSQMLAHTAVCLFAKVPCTNPLLGVSLCALRSATACSR